jgi:hypothetical protein
MLRYAIKKKVLRYYSLHSDFIVNCITKSVLNILQNDTIVSYPNVAIRWTKISQVV